MVYSGQQEGILVIPALVGQHIAQLQHDGGPPIPIVSVEACGVSLGLLAQLIQLSQDERTWVQYNTLVIAADQVG